MIPLTNPDEKSLIKVCSQCGKEQIKAKCLCASCYNKQYFKDNPKKYEHQKRRTSQWNKDNPEKVKETRKKWKINNPDRVKEHRKRDNLKYFKTHPEQKAKALESLKNIFKAQTCKILREHAKEMKDDPEHLTTEFMQKLIGIKCKKSKKV